MSNEPIKIIVVEDSIADVELAIRELKKEKIPFVHVHVDNEDDFIKQLNEFNPDLILCDYSLPTFDGMSALHITRKFSTHLPFIIYTGSIDEATAVNCMKAGANDYIIKQFRTRLPMAVISALEQSKVIKEKELAEKKLIESEEKFRTLSENAEDIIYRFSFFPEYHFEYISPSILKITGYSVEDLYKDFKLGWLLISNKPNTISKENISTNDLLTEATVNFTKKDSSSAWLELKNVIKLPNGIISTVEGIARDITKTMEAQLALEESEKTYKMMFHDNPHPMFVYDLDSLKFIDVNNTAINFYGYSREEFLQMTIKDIRPVEDVPALLENIETHNEEYQNTKYWRHMKKDGSIVYVDVSSHSFNYGNSNSRLVLVTDVTQRYLAEQKLLEAKDKAEKADKLKTNFLAQMSHEIRTPINVIMNFVGLIKDTVMVSKEDTKVMEIAFKSIGTANLRIIRTIDLILNMAELQVGAFEPKKRTFNFYDEVLSKVENDFKIEINNKKLKFSYLLNTQNFEVYGDDYSITQIFVNLVDNAIKYTNAEGTVKIIAERDTQNRLTLTISDSGIGISEEYLNKIFTPFSQEEMGYTRRFEGNGLGLALVKRYCEVNNAQITVCSKKGEGTTFKVVFSETENNNEN